MFSEPELRPISRMLAETGVADLVINGHQYAAVLQNGKWKTVASGYSQPSDLDSAARLLISLGGRRLDLARPFASVDIGAKFRVHALLASAVNPNTHISIRVHAPREVALNQWLAVNKISTQQAHQLKAILNSRESFLISGSAGSGKTTLLRALMGEVSAERVITIEDTAELQVNSQVSVALVAREPNVEGRGEITLNQLLVEALRMRPDRIVVGEVRSTELVTLLQASSSGHSAAATIHANSLNQVLDRIESVAIAAQHVPKHLAQLAKKSIRWFIHLTVENSLRNIEIARND
jgi:pilus assembly protein CpaF